MTGNDLGEIVLTNECQKLEMKDFLRRAKQKLKKVLLEGEIEINGISVIRMAIKNTKTMIDCQRLILSPMIQKNVQNVSMLKSKKMA